MATNDTPRTGQAVTVSLEDLRSGNVSFETLEEAFGPTSLGIIVVKDLPEKFKTLRAQTLSNASYLANLPPADLDALTNASAKYLVGWSHGKETLRPGVVDTLKGSYYVNCAFYQSPSLSSAPLPSSSSSADFPNFPEYTAPNIWPNEDQLPTFRSSLEELCTLIIDTAVLVARACDRYAVEQVEGYKPGYLEHVVKTSLTTKARLLHYFPSPPSPPQKPTPNDTTTTTTNNTDNNEDDWCATHLDHGCLTGLTSAMYIDESSHPPSSSSSSPNLNLPSNTLSTPLPELPTPPDPRAGLYIHSRTSQPHKISIPHDALAFQTGEALQIITKGKFRAVPHYVRGIVSGGGGGGSSSSSSGCGDGGGGAGGKGGGTRVARNTLAVFTQPNLGEVVDLEGGMTFGEFARGVVGRNTKKEDQVGEGGKDEG
ncbi:MAG: hypothetical protein Q9227_000480 [Pyrenula ochraceoflavens]